VADALNQQDELDETNNTRTTSAPMSITAFRPDLALTSVSAPVRAAASRPLAITTKIRNEGPAPAGASTARFYLSADATLDGGDVLLGARSIGPLGAGAVRTDVTTVTVPAGTVVPASYRIIGVADALGQQVELDEGNNAGASGGITVTAFQPDLTITAVTLSNAIAPGRSISVQETVRNVGPAPANRAFTVDFFLSADDTLDAGDVRLGGRTIFTGVAAGAARTDRTTIVVPADVVVPIAYHVIAVVGTVAQPELDSSNNAAVFVSRS
jgi:subtilase family serine protease